MDSCVNVVTNSQELIYQRKQFYSLNMKSGKISHREQTDSNKKKENIMCFSSQRTNTKRLRFVNRKKGEKYRGGEKNTRYWARVAIWWPLWLMSRVEASATDQGTQGCNFNFHCRTCKRGGTGSIYTCQTSTEETSIFKQNLLNTGCIMINPCPVHCSYSKHEYNLIGDSVIK